MKRILSISRGWKQLQQELIDQNLHAQRLQKLHTLLEQEVTGYSLDELAIHYHTLSFFALHTAVTQYVQTGGLAHAEAYLLLSTLARQTGYGLSLRKPGREFERASSLPLDGLATAVLCGQVPAAEDLLETAQIALSREKVPLWNGRPDTRVDQRQEQRRKQRLSLEIGLYEHLLRGEDVQAQALLPQLEAYYANTPVLSVLTSFVERDNKGFTDALILHMREFRRTAYPEELNFFVLLMEALYQTRQRFMPLNLADAPAGLLCLPDCDLTQLEAVLGKPLPCFDVEALVRLADPAKTGPDAKQY